MTDATDFFWGGGGGGGGDGGGGGGEGWGVSWCCGANTSGDNVGKEILFCFVSCSPGNCTIPSQKTF